MSAACRFPVLVLALAVAAGGPPDPTRAQLLGPEFQVNSYTTGGQYAPAVAADGSGNFIVVWESLFQDGSYGGVFGQRFDAAGLPVGSEFQVNSYTTGDQYRQAVAADASGGFVVVWTSDSQDGSFHGVFGQRFDASGVPAGSEFQVNSYTTGSQSAPAVAADGSGNFVVVWNSFGQDGSDDGVFGQRFDATGLPVGNEFQINSHSTGSQYAPAVAADGSGNFIVVWEGDLQDGSSRGVFGQRFDAAGLPVGSEFQVNSYTTEDQYGPAVAASGSGAFVVVWTSDSQDGSYDGVFGQRFDAGGLPAGSEFQVNSYTTAYQYRSAVAAGGAGNFVVVWNSDSQDGSQFGVFGQRFDAAGLPVGSEFQINSYTPNHQFWPAVTADGAGRFVVAWNSSLQDGSQFGVFGRRIMSPSIFADGFEAGDACAWSVTVGGGCP